MIEEIKETRRAFADYTTGKIQLKDDPLLLKINEIIRAVNGLLVVVEAQKDWIESVERLHD